MSRIEELAALAGRDIGSAYGPGRVDDPELIDWYRTVGRSRRTR
ncbi:hypothetical protein [Nocardioides humi]|nr:hypothetical protein [Nocardioides humi]